MHLHFLGPFRLLDAQQRPISFRSRRAVALLAYLVCRPQVIPRPELVDLLWPALPEETGRKNLRWLLSHVRKQAPGLLHVTRQTVQFRPEPGVKVDLWQLEAALAAGDETPLTELLAEAPGELLAGFYLDGAASLETWLAGERARRRAQVAAAYRRALDLLEARAEAAAALRLARQWVQADPLEEAAHRRVMRLLARRGDLAGLRQQYERCRARLAAELDVTPSPETDALFRRLQRQAAAPRHNLPPQPTAFLGRQPELARLRRLLQEQARLVTVLGPGGVGKTRLALEAGRQLAEEAGQTVAFVPLAPVRPAGEAVAAAVLSTLAAAGFIPPMAGQVPPSAYLREQLAGRRLLLILDNVEQLLGEQGLLPLLLSLLQECPELHFLVTSRQRLNLRWEWVLPLAGLPVPAGNGDPAWETYGSVRLFLRELERVRPERTGRRAEVTRIARLVEGLPLALEMAAALAVEEPLFAIAGALEDNLEALATTQRDVPPRHRSLHAVFDHSWELLAPPEQRALARLSLFRGPFRPAAAAAVAGAGPPLLERLRHKSLLRREEDGRHSLHPLLRRYARERLLAQGAYAATRAAHGRHYLAYLEAHSRPVSTLTELAQLEEALAEVQAAWEWATAAGQTAAVAGALPALFRFCDRRSRFLEGAHLLQQALAGLGEAASAAALRSRLLSRQAHFFMRLTRYEEAAERLAAARPLADGEELPFIATLSGELHWRQGAYEPAQAALEQGLAGYREQEDRPGQSRALRSLGVVAYNQGQYREARDLWQQCLLLYRELGDVWGIAATLNNLGIATVGLEAYREARAYCRESRLLCRQLADRRGEAIALLNGGFACFNLALYEEAESQYRESLARFREIHNRRGQAFALCFLGDLAAARQADARAERAYREALALAWETDATPRLLDALVGLARLRQRRQQVAEATRLLAVVRAHPATEERAAQAAAELAATLPHPLPEPPPLETVVRALLR